MRLAATLGLATALLLGLILPAAAAARDQVVVSGNVVVPHGTTANAVVIVDGPVVVAGHVTGDVFAINSTVTVSGTVDGSVTTVVKRARLLPGSRVGGDLNYGEKKPAIAPGAVVSGDVNHEDWNGVGAGVGWALRLILWVTVTVSTLVLGLVLLAFAPRAAEAAWVVSQERTGLACAWAAGVFFGLPIVAVVAMITVFGLPLGIGLLLAYLPLALVGYVTSCWLFGRIVARRRDWGPTRTFLVGWGAARIVALLPFAGALLWVAASAFGLGVLLLAAWYASKPERRVRTAPAPATS
jgi:cytoskeletal protein CcmA (bactofilin family)